MMKSKSNRVTKSKSNRVSNWKSNNEKSDELYVKCKVYELSKKFSFNSWKDKNDIV